MSVRVSLRGLLRLIRVDTLRRVHTVGFLTGRLTCIESTCASYYLYTRDVPKVIGISL